MNNYRIRTDRNGGRVFQSRQSNQHDDRDSQDYDRSNNYNRRYNGGGRQNNRSHSSRARSGGNRNRSNRSVNPRSRLDDDDIDMDGGGSRSRGRQRMDPYARNRQHDRIGGRRLQMDREAEERAVASHRLGLPISRGSSSSSGRWTRGGGSSRGGRRGGQYDKDDWWSKIVIHKGKSFTKDDLLSKLHEIVSVPFQPVSFSYEKETAVFYVRDKRTADAIQQCSRQIQTAQGFKLVIITKPAPPPSDIPLTEAEVEKLKVAMSNRYDVAGRSLDLSNLGRDEELRNSGVQVTLNRPSRMEEVLSIIKEHIPELVILNLSDTRLSSLVSLKKLHTYAPNLTHLNIGKNKIHTENELDHIKNLQLVELHLDGNELCDRFSSETAYISAIRQRFPKVLRLDGHDLPPPITFDVESVTTLPPTQGSFFLDETTKDLVCCFLEQYFRIYDSADRQPLFEAYHEQAVFSMCVGFSKIISGKQTSLSDYMHESRNLIRVSDPARRQRALKVGRLNVVACLAQLPNTQHDPAAFVVDVTHVSPAMMVFTVHGLFKEPDSKLDTIPIRTFSRTFITVPQGTGIVIINEELMVSNATPGQVQAAFRNPAPTPSSSPVQDVVPAAPSVEKQQELATNFSAQSGMNLDWSVKCLTENDWDYEKSARVFTDLQAKGSIPPEAFIK